ncbi:PilZ domain-containing protein [Propionivibrio sp.]|uniref:PilZ domain-containing protein n=1 Tax=Propionivibrio sp. TaxID=2212460 RepID=UPI0026072B44|nr:PilZ domain-containing protein [Propionivibrio sp.]
MSAAPTDDRRHYSRIAFHTPARLIFPEREIDVRVLDLSLKGALIRLPAQASITAGATCRLQVLLSEGESADQISMETRVTHVEGDNAGLHCLIIDIDSVTHLRRLVEFNLGDPALLDREISALIAE